MCGKQTFTQVLLFDYQTPLSDAGSEAAAAAFDAIASGGPLTVNAVPEGGRCSYYVYIMLFCPTIMLFYSTKMLF